MNIDLAEINVDLLNDCGYENYLAECDPNLIEYQIKLTNAANEKRQSGNGNLGVVLDLLSLACAPILQSSNDKKPFSHHCLTKEQAKLFCQFAKVVNISELKARLADLAWVILRDYASAKIAINAYAESTENIYFQRNWVDLIDRLERALMIARSLKDEQEIDKIKIKLFNLIDPENKYFILESGNRICRMALDLKLIPPVEIAERAVILVDMMPANFSSYDFQFYLLKTAEKSFLKAGDINRAKAIKLRAAEALVQKADLVEKVPGQKLLSAQCLAEGIAALKQCQGQKNRVIDLQKKLVALNKASLEEMEKFSFSMDLSRYVKMATSAMQGKSCTESLRAFAFLISSPPKKNLEGLAIEAAKHMEIAATIPKSVINEDGKPVVFVPPLLTSIGEEYKLALKAGCCDQAKLIYTGIVGGMILPARAELLRMHEINKEILFEIIKKCSFIPDGRKRIWARGFLAGFQNDFVTALSFLIPQFEHALRKCFENMGERVWRIDNANQYSEVTLNELLYMDASIQIFGEDLLFNLKCLLTERVGCNFRNEFAHGLMEEEMFSSTPAIYLWWLFFQLIIRMSD